MSPATAPKTIHQSRPGKGRVLVEFSDSLLRRTDEAVRKLKIRRSEFIRTAVQQRIEEMDAQEFERELADAYTANSQLNLKLADDFAAIDREGF